MKKTIVFPITIFLIFVSTYTNIVYNYNEFKEIGYEWIVELAGDCYYPIFDYGLIEYYDSEFEVGFTIQNSWNNNDNKDKDIESGWIGTFKKVAIEEINKGIEINNFGPALLSFGIDSLRWNHFKSYFKEGDTLYQYISGDSTWEHLCGRAGYVLVRNNECIKFFRTAMN